MPLHPAMTEHDWSNTTSTVGIRTAMTIGARTPKAKADMVERIRQKEVAAEMLERERKRKLEPSANSSTPERPHTVLLEEAALTGATTADASTYHCHSVVAAPFHLTQGTGCQDVGENGNAYGNPNSDEAARQGQERRSPQGDLAGLLVQSKGNGGGESEHGAGKRRQRAPGYQCEIGH